MKLGLFTVMYQDNPLEQVADEASALGYEMFELAAWKDSAHFDIDQATSDASYGQGIKKMLAERGIGISALSNHLEGQMVLPPADSSLDDFARTSDKNEMFEYGKRRIIQTAQVASDLEVETVVGFFGSTVWESWYIWPPQRLEIYERGWDLFVERWDPILDEFKKLGVKFAHECHPTEIAYNIHTAGTALEKLPREEWGFNYDPSHFVWQMIDPVIFIKKYGNKILHVHAKDWEVQPDDVPTDGVLSTGSWQRPGRANRYRVPGWGDINWRRIITALLETGYDGTLSFEHEDPVMSERDGLEQAIKFLQPLMIKEPLSPDTTAWWMA